MLVDLIIPQINGEKLCRIIRKMPEHDPIFIIIISAIAAEEKVDFLSFGANACIAKGSAKQMHEHLATVLEHCENDNVDLLGKKIFGEENIFERDITKELLATKKHLAITLNNMDEGLVELNSDAHVIFANPVSFQLLGLREERCFRDFSRIFLLGRTGSALLDCLKNRMKTSLRSGKTCRSPCIATICC